MWLLIIILWTAAQIVVNGNPFTPIEELPISAPQVEGRNINPR